jgi:SulP family sulfate permease
VDTQLQDRPEGASRLRDLFVPSLLGVLRGGLSAAQLRSDLFGGLTAAVVALPLALAFGVASGAGPIAGLYGAITVGFLAALFGGTPAQVSGPTGPMTVVMAAILASHADSLPEAFAIVMLGGLIQIGFGALRLGRYIVYTPYSVVSGFMTGIGVIIMIIQILPFGGLPTAPGGVIGSLSAIAGTDLASLDWQAGLLAVGSLALLVAWPARLGRVLPAPLAVLALGTTVAMLALPNAPVIGPVPSGLPTLVNPLPSLPGLAGLVQPAFVLALLGSIDSLLTSLVADSITKTTHDSDKELVGQGIGNVCAGLLGALPGGGATMRTVVNVRAGGRSPLSGCFHALVLLALALGCGSVVANVPHAVLAAILMKVGWDIMDWGYLRRMRHAPRDKFVVMLVTFGLTVFVDLVTAVAVGIILASFVNSRWLSAEQLKGIRHVARGAEVDRLTTEEMDLLDQAEGRVLVTQLRGSFSYASARDLARRAAPQLAGVEFVVYDFSQAGYVDTSATLAIQEMFALTRGNGQAVLVAALTGQARRALEGLGALDRIPAENQFPDRLAAMTAAVERAEGPAGTRARRDDWS